MKLGKRTVFASDSKQLFIPFPNFSFQLSIMHMESIDNASLTIDSKLTKILPTQKNPQDSIFLFFSILSFTFMQEAMAGADIFRKSPNDLYFFTLAIILYIHLECCVHNASMKGHQSAPNKKRKKKKAFKRVLKLRETYQLLLVLHIW